MMCWANLLSAIRIMKALSSLPSVMKKIAALCQHHQCGMLNLECALPFAIHIRDRSGKFE
jgi:hypothetical protein